jgi:hypothetical protein
LVENRSKIWGFKGAGHQSAGGDGSSMASSDGAPGPVVAVLSSMRVPLIWWADPCPPASGLVHDQTRSADCTFDQQLHLSDPMAGFNPCLHSQSAWGPIGPQLADHNNPERYVPNRSWAPRPNQSVIQHPVSQLARPTQPSHLDRHTVARSKLPKSIGGGKHMNPCPD